MPVSAVESQDNSQFDQEVDVLVVGSGAGALTAAVVARVEGCKDVLVVEKSAQYGGTSAMSGGGIWIPNSHYARAEGVQDSAKEALTYLKAVIGDEVSEARLRAYVEKAPEMLEYLARHSRVAFEPVPYSDYYPEMPGGKEGHRTHQPLPVNARHLKQAFRQLREPPPQVLVAGKLTMTMKEGRAFLTQAKGWMWTAVMMALRYYLDIPGRLQGKRSRRLTMGNALIGRLRWSMLEQGIALWLNAPMASLIEENGVVLGAVINKEGRPLRVRARKGVVIGAGGFEHNLEMRKQYLPQPTNPEWSGSQTNNTGDGIQAAMKIGAQTDLMAHAWWAPSVKIPKWDRPYVIFAERSLPGLVIVNKAGKRFQNEAAPYLESGLAFYTQNKPQEPTFPSYVVFDATFRKKFPFGPIPPGYSMPDNRIAKRVWDVLVKADNLQALAEKIGVDAAGLQETVRKNNEYAKSGVDPEFHRGESYYDRYYGDARTHPNPCIAPIAEAPFYALPIHPGDIGTKGGILTDPNGCAVDESGEVIPGLYVIGNSAASVMGSKYPGAGATLGPAMTFGYLAARHAAKQQDVAQISRATAAPGKSPQPAVQV
ncbi:MAG: 3-oxosteroid 1-dehydrogenase [Pseudomonadales bacterium]|nr:3-oxosteroid 1-dehydrogenase [Pseudomonadales bacterium]MEC8811755.1 FAD-binding protein [Pseudomonadota bacterium]HAG93329.1 3-oxosteroid 1-dehydrogenase [Gammaproteobacteria bacterium]HAU14561.1 3-oxosteroid 1-dehydrogenase [Gammaproteobacteria bacterium]|tara:strand:- start:89924 stop:91711 length:1788 start_codon:yes stop_codon:yes gene_type:complete